MDIEATCGCGARVKIHPDNGGYQNSHYGIEAKTREEREACSAAFKEWVQAHAGCVRPQRFTSPPYATAPSLWPAPDAETDPARSAASGT